MDTFRRRIVLFIRLLLVVAWLFTGWPPAAAFQPSSGRVQNTVLPGVTQVSPRLPTQGNSPVFLPIVANASGTSLPTPPDPGDVASEISDSEITDFAAATAFLYSGVTPIQFGVTPGTMKAQTVAVLRGKVSQRNGKPLAGVTIGLLSHPEFGQTMSRADGHFDIAVNGGEQLVVSYTKQGLLPVQRLVQAPWRDYATVDDVVMIAADGQVTPIDLSPTTFQAALGSMVTDDDGRRRTALLIPPGTRAEIFLEDGSKQAVDALHVRLTEFTVGESGPAAMPGELPPNSGYTYAVEVTADEAVAKVNGMDVLLSQPAFLYLNNYLGYPVGEIVPMGHYDNDHGVWVPQENGKVIQILNIAGGLAGLDVDGDGAADTGQKLVDLGVTEGEERQLAQLYQPGDSLWRMPLTHFSTMDGNFPTGAADGTSPPDLPTPNNPGGPQPNMCPKPGSIITAQSQVLGEKIALVGTPFHLHYSSNRVAGRKAQNSLSIPLNGPVVHPTLLSIFLNVDIAGQHHTESFPPQPNQSTIFTWDGLDAYGRSVQGAQPVSIELCYAYQGVMLSAAQNAERAFARSSGSADAIAGVEARLDILKCSSSHSSVENALGTFDARGQHLGGWTLDINHLYDPIGHVLHQGDGTTRSGVETVAGLVIDTAVGSGDFCRTQPSSCGDGLPATQADLAFPHDVIVGHDGSLYIAEDADIRRVDPNGVMSTVAGTGGVCSRSDPNGQDNCGDGGPATAAQIRPTKILLAPDGSLIFLDAPLARIRRVGLDGIITTIAGTGRSPAAYPESCRQPTDKCGDGGPASEADLVEPRTVAFGPDGSLYVADGFARVRQIGTDGIIETVAGTGEFCQFGPCGDGGPATHAQLNSPAGLVVAADGTLYIADTGAQRVRRVGPDGIIETVAGTGLRGMSGDGGPAILARLSQPVWLALGPDGALYITDSDNSRIRRVSTDGIIITIAGTGDLSKIIPGGFNGDKRPAATAQLAHPGGIAVAPDGAIYVADGDNQRLRRIANALPEFSGDDITVVSEDGQQIYIFDPGGRHRQTRDALTNALIYQFDYDAAGRLIKVTDRAGNQTTVERDGKGNPTAIVGPYGQRTTLKVETATGYLTSVTNPANEKYQMSYAGDGLLASFTDPGAHTSSMSYDNLGLLTQEQRPVNSSWTLNRLSASTGYTVSLTSAEGRISRFQVEDLPGGARRNINTTADAHQTTLLSQADGSNVITFADGTVVTQVDGSDPRWGLQAPLPVLQRLETPDGVTFSRNTTRTATLSDPNNPNSLLKLTETGNINGRLYTSVHDAATRKTSVTTPMGRVDTTTWDAQGRIIADQRANSAPQQYAYDNRGRMKTLTWGTGAKTRTTTLAYDAGGYFSAMTDALNQKTTYSYDDAGRITEIGRADGQSILFGYDANGNLTSLTPPGRPAHRFTYTAAGQLAGYEMPDVGNGVKHLLLSYNSDRQLVQMTRADAAIITFSYDPAGRLVATSIPRGEIRRLYDPATGQLASLIAPGGLTTAYSYDGHLLTGIGWSGPVNGQVAITYDNDLRLASLKVNDGQPVVYHYDLDGLLLQAGGYKLQRSATTGLVESGTLNKVTDATTYDGFGQLAAYSAAANGATIFHTEVTRDALGRISQVGETIGNENHTFHYSYDSIGRLVEVKEGNAAIATYTYDANGNRLSYTGTGGTLDGSYDNRDQLLQFGDTTFTYSENGNLRSKSANGQATQYDYDALGNLTGVTLADNTRIDYLIDGNNRRVGRSVNGVMQQGFLYQNGFQLAAELDGNGNVLNHFVYATKRHVPDYMERNGIQYRIITDELGSVRLVVNAASGAIEQRIDYDAFGRVLQDTNPGFQPFGFAGGLYDPLTGLTRFGLRDYDAEVGRWTSQDPLNFAGGSTNLYTYADNDPVNHIDPYGLVLPLILGVAVAEILIDAGIATAIIAAGALAADAITDTVEGLSGSDLWDLIDQIIAEIEALGKPDVTGTPWDDDPTRPDITRPIPLPVPDVDPTELPTDPNIPSPWEPSGGGGTGACK